MGLVGSILINPDCLYELRGKYRVVPAMIYEPRHQHVLEACYSLQETGRPIDLLTVQQKLSDSGKIDLVGGVSGLVQYVDATPTAAHVRHYAEIVVKKAKQRRFISVCRDALDGAYHDPDIEKVLSRAVYNLNEMASDEIVHDRTNVDILDEHILQWEEAHQRRKSGTHAVLKGLSTSFGRFDQLTGGLQPGLHFIAAPPSAGKTCIEGQIAEHVARAHGPVLRIYLDDTQEDAVGRTASRIGGFS